MSTYTSNRIRKDFGEGDGEQDYIQLCVNGPPTHIFQIHDYLNLDSLRKLEEHFLQTGSVSTDLFRETFIHSFMASLQT